MNISRLFGSLATAILLFSNTPIFAQCPSGSVTLGSQAAVNAFAINYGTCSSIPGDLIIGDNIDPIVDSDINDISSLTNITTISGDLIIRANPLLTNLAGLENLTVVNQDFYITDNTGLTNIDDLTSLTNVNQYFEISYNSSLDHISNLNNLTVNLLLRIMDNDALTNISGLNNLTTFRALDIRENGALTTITGISNYTTGTTFVLLDNPVLTSIPNFSFSVPAPVIVTGNGQLSICSAPGFCESVDGGFPSIFDLNSAGCSSMLQVEMSCLLVSLPVELVSFEATKKGRSAELNWMTSSEQNNQGFIVEHSLDGQRWNKIEFVEGKGNSNLTNSYSLTHSNVAPNQNYYRLQQLDFNGIATISEIKRLNFKLENKKDLVQVYPNPTSGSFRIVLPTEEGVRSNLKLSDIQGRIIWEKQLDGTENSDLFFEDFDLPAPQQYFLHVQSGTEIGVQRIQVLEK